MRIIEVARDRRLSVHPWLELSKFVPWKEGRGGPEVASRMDCYRRVVDQLGRRQDLACAWRERRQSWLGPLRDRGLVRVETPLVSRTGAVLWLSAPTALELGFCLHHTYGLPYLPATALKGLARAAAVRRYGGSDDDPAPDVKRVFGAGGDTGLAGPVDFLDGLPLVADCLEPDVMTPHHANYYQRREKWPHDSEGPVPLPFLRIKPGAEFEVALLARRAEHRQRLDQAADLLLEGLRDLGLGAKTTSGYGVFDGGTAASCGPAGDSSAGVPSSEAGERLLVRAVRLVKDRHLLAADDAGREYEIPLWILAKAGIMRPQWRDLAARKATLAVAVEGDRVVTVQGEVEA